MGKKTDKKITKQHLKTLTQSGGSHHIRTTGRVLKYGTINFGRNIWLSTAATLVMTITLLILFVTVIASVVLSQTADAMRDKIDITIFFKPGTSETALAEMSETMKTDPNVKSIETSDSAAEYANFLEENADNEELMAVLEDEDMKAIMLNTMQATMRVKVKDVNNLDSIKTIVSENPLFQENLDEDEAPTYDVNQTEIAAVTSWANIAKNGGLILGAVFLVISVLVIFNTIRMAIFSRREEIYMMKLVGADRNFIRGPFLVEAQMCGIISGVLAATLGYLGFHFLAPKLTDYGIDVSTISAVLESNTIMLYYAVMMLAGIVVGSISARLAIQKYLNKA